MGGHLGFLCTDGAGVGVLVLHCIQDDRPISTILQKNRGLWTVYVNFLQSFARIISPDNVVCYALKW